MTFFEYYMKRGTIRIVKRDARSEEALQKKKRQQKLNYPSFQFFRRIYAKMSKGKIFILIIICQ